MQKKEEIVENYIEIKNNLDPSVQLVAVTKTHSVSAIQKIYDEGQRVFGENKVQELVEKHTELPRDIKWHLIGHLQTNKVKYVAPFVDTIESVDSEKVLKEINKQAAKHNRQIKVLLQVKIAKEDTKFGLEASEARSIYSKYLNGEYPHTIVTGLMGMATFTDNEEQIIKEFNFLKQLFDDMSGSENFSVLSMGMSSDFKVAINCGANSVRIGSSIFGNRDYSNTGSQIT